ncbi:MAG: TylF/MycF family methyltransferase [Nitrospiraceae bacterium]|nr:TylF/MycF family methyltransferase [Nitrospiraceae bacterium]
MDQLKENRALYLDLLQKCILNIIYEDPSMDPWSSKQFDINKRLNGLDWPSRAHSMIGMMRMSNLRQLCELVIQNNVPGDFIETGVWRGGGCIMMRGVLKSYGVRDRNVWVADSFEGLPEPDPEKYPDDAGDRHHTFAELAVSMEDVQENFRKYDLLDDQVRFLKGFFKDTLPGAPIKSLAILRLDGDMYESTIQALECLYDKLNEGGFVIVDDFGAVQGCKKAILDFREQRDIFDPIYNIDGIGAYWQKTRG